MNRLGRGTATIAMLIAGCGSRSNLYSFNEAAPGGNGGGGAATTAGGSGGAATSSGGASTSTSTGGASPTCDGLVVLDPVIEAPTPGLARAPGIGLLLDGSDVLFSFVEAPPGTPGPLRAGHLDAFETWPPTLTTPVTIDADVLDIVAGAGPDGPVALIRHQPGDPSFFATSLSPGLQGFSLFTGNAEPLFATAIPDRYLAAQSTHTPDYDVLGVGSYQPGSLPQSEQPLVCLDSPPLAAGVPSGSGFLAALLRPDLDAPPCGPGPKLPGTAISFVRYHVPSPAPGTFLELQPGDLLGTSDPIVLLGLTPTSFGAWVVFQSNGASAETPPPILAMRVGPSATLLAPGSPIPVSPQGQVYSQLAVASLGDTLAVAWVDALDPSAPTIVVQLVRADGSLGPVTSIATNLAWQSGRLQLLPSAGGQSLLVAWEAGFDEARVGLARIDCVTAL